MKKLDALHRKLSSLPTILILSDEISIVGDLMQLTPDDINSNTKLFCEIVETVVMSHTDYGYFELNGDNEGTFLEFYKWLVAIDGKINVNLADIGIENFNMTSNEFAKSMQPYAKITL